MSKALLSMRRAGGFTLLFPVITMVSAVAEPMTLVKGRLIYPSDYMPAQLVCAVSTSTGRDYALRLKKVTGDLR